jgi:cell division protein FtsI (penicillin-binding protein 3)
MTVTRRGFIALFGVVAARLFYLQIVDGADLASAAESNRTNVATLHAKRGTIYDRNGNVLAMSIDCSTIYCNPQNVHDPSGLATVLASILGGEYNDYLADVTKDTTFVYVQRQVDADVVKRLKSELSDKDIEGVYYLDDTKRVYPYGGTCGQILGVVGTDGQGITGLELQYDDILTGTDGEMIMETGLGGTPIAGGTYEVTDAVNGTDVILGIDVNIQEKAETALVDAVKTYKAESGSILVMNPKTGEIHCACSTPLANVSDLSTVDSDGLTLKLVSMSYEPGSVFKVITTSTGIEAGLFDSDSTYPIPETIQVGDDTVTDDDSRDYTMEMTIREMLRRSSNVAMAYLVQEVIGAKTFSKGVDAFGIGHKTGIDYPGEVEGIVKAYEDYDGSTAGSMAFGQGVAVPMIQIARAFSAVANGGSLVTPHFLAMKGDEEVEWDPTAGPISKDTADQVTDMMRTVMKEGTGKNGQVEGYDIAGKTGTGEQSSSEGGYAEYNYTASLCGFANASDPQVLVYVGLNGVAYLAKDSAAPLFATIMSEAVTDLNIPPATSTT